MHLQLLHGLTMHVVNSARAALLLMDQGLAVQAAPLVRIALEHAAAVQWVVVTPAGAEQFTQQASFKSAKFRDVVERVGFEIPEDMVEYYKNAPKPRANRTLSEVRKMFLDLDPTEWLYVQYAYLSGYVHPSTTVVSAYLDTSQQPAHLLLHGGHEPRPLLLTLTLSLSAATAAYLDLVLAKPYKARIRKITETVGVPMWFTPDGKPPKHDVAQLGRASPGHKAP